MKQFYVHKRQARCYDLCQIICFNDKGFNIKQSVQQSNSEDKVMTTDVCIDAKTNTSSRQLTRAHKLQANEKDNHKYASESANSLPTDITGDDIVHTE